MTGKLIVIDGVDGAGKTTQAELLIQALKENSPVSYFDFPRYHDSIYGELVGRCLKGEFGDFLTMSPYVASLPYILDRVSAKADLLKALKKSHVVCNRYTTSNIAHQAGKLPKKDQNAFVEFIEKGEYDELGIPKPDCVIFLNIPIETTQDLIKKREKRAFNKDGKDTSDTNLAYQINSAKVYRGLAQSRDNWFIVECMESNVLQSPDAIHKKVLSVVESFFSV